ncbi:MAG: hypothetical protein ACRYF3_07315, partial [Janthinobacterium lividum]
MTPLPRPPLPRPPLPRLPLSAVFPPPPGPGRAGDTGIGPACGPFWSVTAERATVLGGPAAILLQIA